ncbi:MAG: 2-hydroxyacyl-CoA dehydratase [Chloroflexi bacterium]|nr:2-hydroxyacyl-CoA dehydratase [Chloroflexota bacterium]
MTAESKHQKWETRPLKCWDKAKEIRRKYDKGRVEAEQKGKQLVDGLDGSIFAALGDLQATMTNPLGAMIANRNPTFSRQCLAEGECQGFGREICGYHREVFGSMYLDRDLEGGTFPRRDISIPTPSLCNQHSKRGQPVADYFRIPRYQGEAPGYTGADDPERDKTMLDHRVAEVLEEIEWLEKQTGRKFDDEVYIEHVKSSMRIGALKAEVSCLNQNIPAPVDQKSLYSFFTLGGLVRGDQDATEELWRELRDEIKWRVKNRIAGVGTERYRWVEDQPPPWSYLRYYRYMEKYGAVCIGSPYTLGGSFDVQPDGSFVPRKTLLQLGIQITTREQAIRATLRPGEQGPNGAGHQGDTPGRAEFLVNMTKAFKVQGAIRPLHRAGIGCDYGSREISLALTEIGVRVMHYETGQPGDRTDLDENRLLDQLDHWMESQGLRKLED